MTQHFTHVKTTLELLQLAGTFINNKQRIGMFIFKQIFHCHFSILTINYAYSEYFPWKYKTNSLLANNRIHLAYSSMANAKSSCRLKLISSS